MAKITINQERCKGCFLCVDVCPKRSLKQGKKLNQRGASYVEFIAGSQCVGCTLCAVICPECCIEVYK